jgi:hypothetical protein
VAASEAEMEKWLCGIIKYDVSVTCSFNRHRDHRGRALKMHPLKVCTFAEAF